MLSHKTITQDDGYMVLQRFSANNQSSIHSPLITESHVSREAMVPNNQQRLTVTKLTDNM